MFGEGAVAQQVASDGKWFTATVIYSFSRWPSGKVWHETQTCKLKDSHRHGIQAFLLVLLRDKRNSVSNKYVVHNGADVANVAYRRYLHYRRYLPTLPNWKPAVCYICALYQNILNFCHYLSSPSASFYLLSLFEMDLNVDELLLKRFCVVSGTALVRLIWIKGH